MQISKEIIEVLDYLCNKFGIVIDWTDQNVIPYLEQLFAKFIAWEYNTSIAYIVIFSILIILFIAIIILSIKFIDCEEIKLTIITILCIAIIGFMVGIGSQVFDIIECKVFPEKLLYDYIQKMINSN